jgi:hypothetical protein
MLLESQLRISQGLVICESDGHLKERHQDKQVVMLAPIPILVVALQYGATRRLLTTRRCTRLETQGE